MIKVRFNCGKLVSNRNNDVSIEKIDEAPWNSSEKMSYEIHYKGEVINPGYIAPKIELHQDKCFLGLSNRTNVDKVAYHIYAVSQSKITPSTNIININFVDTKLSLFKNNIRHNLGVRLDRELYNQAIEKLIQLDFLYKIKEYDDFYIVNPFVVTAGTNEQFKEFIYKYKDILNNWLHLDISYDKDGLCFTLDMKEEDYKDYEKNQKELKLYNQKD